MNNEQLLYWIEGYLSDKHSTEAYAIKNKIAAQRSTVPISSTGTASPSIIRIPGAGRNLVPDSAPMPTAAPVWMNCASEPDPF